MNAGRITALADVPDDSTFLFRVVDDSGDEREAILVADGTATTDGDDPNADGIAC
ncbi:hypothetical protein JCM9743_36990 [Natrinema sp. JCM 9743]